MGGQNEIPFLFPVSGDFAWAKRIESEDWDELKRNRYMTNQLSFKQSMYFQYEKQKYIFRKDSITSMKHLFPIFNLTVRRKKFSKFSWEELHPVHYSHHLICTSSPTTLFSTTKCNSCPFINCILAGSCNLDSPSKFSQNLSVE